MRLFIAFLPDEETRQRLEDIQRSMKEKGIRGRYTDPFNLHMTLLFIGEYGDPDHVMDVLEEIPFEQCTLTLSHIERMHDMYLCIVKDNDEVSSYVRRLHRACAEQEIPFDRKSFLPHITLLRKADVNNEPDLSELIQEQTMPVSAISLMKSEHGKNGMVYTEIGRIEYIPEHHE